MQMVWRFRRPVVQQLIIKLLHFLFFFSQCNYIIVPMGSCYVNVTIYRANCINEEVKPVEPYHVNVPIHISVCITVYI